ncbi:MAG: hypothetical protein ACOC46_01045, partial [Pirellulales bacterium]
PSGRCRPSGFGMYCRREGFAYLTQTTISAADADRVLARLRARFPAVVGPAKGDICYATQNRQEAVRRLSHGVDRVLVVGSGNSSNSRRLAELARAEGVAAELVDGPADICHERFTGDEVVLVTAGASAPEWVVQECVTVLKQRYGATVETREICDEEVRFALPTALRDG